MKQRFYIDTSVWGGLFDKEFDTVKTFREIKENISKDIWGLSHEKLMNYFESSKRKTVRV